MMHQTNLYDPFELTNTTSLQLIPASVQPVISRILDMVRAVYDPQLNGAFYLYGSVVSGTFVEGSSDIDGVWISNTPLTDDHPERRQTWFDTHLDVDQLPVTKLDIIAMEVGDVSDPIRVSVNFNCYYNGLRYAGDLKADFEQYIPRTRGDYLMRTHRLDKYIKAFADERKEMGAAWLRRNFVKTVARSWFMKAYAAGCPYTQSMRDMSMLLEQHDCKLEFARFTQLMDLYAAPTLSEEEKDQAFSDAWLLNNYFRDVLRVYNSEYAAWIRSGDKQ